MAITVKDTYGNAETVATNGKANLGVALGAIGTGLGVLNGGLGIFGNGLMRDGVVNEVVNGGGGFVPITKYYEDRIQDIKEVQGQFTAVREDICNLRERASVSETANHYQNLMTQQAFGYVDSRFATERLVTDYEIGARTCDFLKATKVLTPNQMGTTYANPTMVLDQHEVRFLEEERGRCGCGGYRGF